MGVTQILAFALGVTQVLAFLDTNMLVSPTQNSRVGGIAQHDVRDFVLHAVGYRLNRNKINKLFSFHDLTLTSVGII